MIRRFLFIFALITALLLIMAATVYLSLQHEQEKKVIRDPLLADAVLLESLLPDKSNNAEKKLAELSTRQDAVGYLANVELGRRLSGSSSTEHYKIALSLYYSSDMEKELASSFLKTGEVFEAANAYASALPDKDAMDSIKSLSLGADAIGQILLDNNKSLDAADYLKTEIEKAVDEDFKSRLQKLYAKALGNLEKYKDALPLLETLKAKYPKDNDILWWDARCLEALGQTGKAKEIYNSMGNMGGYRLGLILENEGKLSDAASAYLRSSDPESMWKGAYILDSLGKHDKALEVYRKLSSVESVYQDDAAYRAYILIKRNKGSGAEDLLPIISKHPSWMVRLGLEPNWPQITQVTYEKPEFMKRMEAYEDSSRDNMAKIELYIGEKNANVSEKLALGDWYLSMGDYYDAARWGMKALIDQPDKHAYELAYQRPYEEQVEKAADEFGLDQNLIYAVIRGESYYSPSAVSRAGARGLMQIMPATGKYIASNLKITYNENDLTDPETNVRFGAYYIKSLLDMFSGDTDKALAAYNGGPGNVNRWSKSGIGSTKEDFPTAVSFLETREYITKIQDYYCVYKRLYGEE